jgi:hypothetical protein
VLLRVTGKVCGTEPLINEIESGRYPVGDLPSTEFKLRRKPLYSPQGA